MKTLELKTLITASIAAGALAVSAQAQGSAPDSKELKSSKWIIAKGKDAKKKQGGEHGCGKDGGCDGHKKPHGEKTEGEHEGEKH